MHVLDRDHAAAQPHRDRCETVQWVHVLDRDHAAAQPHQLGKGTFYKCTSLAKITLPPATP